MVSLRYMSRSVLREPRYRFAAASGTELTVKRGTRDAKEASGLPLVSAYLLEHLADVALLHGFQVLIRGRGGARRLC